MNDIEFENLNKMIKKANRRLQNLEKFSGKDVSWAGKRLQASIDNEKIGAWSQDNLIQISKNMSDIELQRVYRATEDFLNSKTSTISGVKDTIKKTIKSIGVDVGVSRDEAESLYTMLSDDTFRYIKEHSSASASEIWDIITEAKERRLNFYKFRQYMYEAMQVIPDKEVNRNISNLYLKNVLGAED